jgi:hypothetical protein
MLNSKIPAKGREAIADEIVAITEKARKKYNLTLPEAKHEIVSIVRDVSL